MSSRKLLTRWTLAAVVPFFMTISSCQGEKKSGKHDEEPAPEGQQDGTGAAAVLNDDGRRAVQSKSLASNQSTVIGTPGESKTAHFQVKELARKNLLVPEQFSGFLTTAFGFNRLSQPSDWWGFQNDWLLRFYNVKLGGADYQTTFKRQEVVTPQILLSMRDAAYQFISDLIWKDYKRRKDGEATVFFIKADPLEDRPFREEDLNYSQKYQNKMREGEKKWEEQVRYTFQLFFRRSATDAEIAIVRAHFLKIMEAEKDKASSYNAWLMCLTNLLMVEEVWNI
jgi:hypothetical protein